MGRCARRSLCRLDPAAGYCTAAQAAQVPAAVATERMERGILSVGGGPARDQRAQACTRRARSRQCPDKVRSRGGSVWLFRLATGVGRGGLYDAKTGHTRKPQACAGAPLDQIVETTCSNLPLRGRHASQTGGSLQRPQTRAGGSAPRQAGGSMGIWGSRLEDRTRPRHLLRHPEAGRGQAMVADGVTAMYVVLKVAEMECPQDARKQSQRRIKTGTGTRGICSNTLPEANGGRTRVCV